MVDLIDRQAAINEAYTITIDGAPIQVVQVETLLGLPSVKPERQKGEWIDVGHKMGLFSHPESVNYKCSCCGYEQYTIFGFGLLRTCPNCGADMRGEENGHDDPISK